MTKAAPKTPAPIVAVSVQQLADTLGVSTSTCQRHFADGCPGNRGAYPLKEILAWLRQYGPWRPRLPKGTDPLLIADGDSPALERYREARAAMAELDLAERQQELIDREKCREVLGRWAAVMRRFSETAGKRWGNAAILHHNEMIASCEAVIEELKGHPDPAADEGDDADA